MDELASLLSNLPYVVAVALVAAFLHRLAGWTEGPSVASLVGGPPELPWPRGVQEEEPASWNLAAIEPRRGLSHQSRVAEQPHPACSTPCQPVHPAKRPLA